MDDDMSDENHLYFPYIKFEKTFLTILNDAFKRSLFRDRFFFCSIDAGLENVTLKLYLSEVSSS